MLFFPTFISGPIDRYDRFKEDFNKNTFEVNIKENPDWKSIYTISLGLFKKVVLTSIVFKYCYFTYDSDALRQLSLGQIILGAYAYTFYLYFDFSGYTDISVGVSKLLGISTPRNFNYPFSATNIQDYWNRWHITLSQWIRDYLFTPIYKFLLKVEIVNAISASMIAIFLAFFLSGIWHGDDKNFMIWGALHGLALSFYALYSRIMKKKYKVLYNKLRENRYYLILSWFITFNFVVLTMFVFGLPFEKMIILMGM